MNYLLETQRPKLKKKSTPEADDPDDVFEPVPAYALQPVPQAFGNIKAALLPMLIPFEGVKSFDVTGFYSRRKSNLTTQNESEMTALDIQAELAAAALGGLVTYYRGKLIDTSPTDPPNPELGLNFTPNCLSFCVWASLEQAKAGSQVSPHRSAVSKTQEWYDGFGIRKYKIELGGIDASELRDPDEIVFREVLPRNL